jgi:hypothetical protein
MLAQAPSAVSIMSEKALRRQIDRAVSRALVDGEFASLLLANPTVVLEDHGCPPQQYLSLRGIQANNLVGFARQAQALFWSSEPLPFDHNLALRQLNQEEQRPRAAVAVR